MNTKDDVRYYSVKKHKIWIIFLMLLTFCLCVFILPFLIKIVYKLFVSSNDDNFINWIWCLIDDNAESNDLLPSFLGGLVGIIIGFFMEMSFIHRLRLLNKYNSFIVVLKQELQKVKQNCYDLSLKKAIKEYEDLISPQFISWESNVEGIRLFNKSDLRDSLRMYDYKYGIKNDKSEIGSIYYQLYVALTEKLKKDETFRETTINSQIDIKYELSKNHVSEKDYNYIIEWYNLSSRVVIPNIHGETLASIVLSAENYAIFFNMPRFCFWTPKGVLARCLKDMHDLITYINSANNTISFPKLLILWKLYELDNKIDEFNQIICKN